MACAMRPDRAIALMLESWLQLAGSLRSRGRARGASAATRPGLQTLEHSGALDFAEHTAR
jgi:hypothetical protein